MRATLDPGTAVASEAHVRVLGVVRRTRRAGAPDDRAPATSTAYPPAARASRGTGPPSGCHTQVSPTVAPRVALGAALVTWPTGTPSRSSSSPPQSTACGSSTTNDASRRGGPSRALALDHLAADEGSVAGQVAGEGQAGLDRGAVRAELRAERAVALVEPQRVDGVVAGQAQARGRRRRRPAGPTRRVASSVGTVSSQPSSPT